MHPEHCFCLGEEPPDKSRGRFLYHFLNNIIRNGISQFSYLESYCLRNLLCYNLAISTSSVLEERINLNFLRTIPNFDTGIGFYGMYILPREEAPAMPPLAARTARLRW
jgi:hypothetical protein